MDVHVTSAYLMVMYLMGVHLIGVYLIGVRLIDVYMFPIPKRLWGNLQLSTLQMVVDVEI